MALKRKINEIGKECKELENIKIEEQEEFVNEFVQLAEGIIRQEIEDNDLAGNSNNEADINAECSSHIDSIKRDSKDKKDNTSLNGYNKKQIVKILSRHGTNAERVNGILKNYTVQKDVALEILNKSVHDAQANVYQECPTEEFLNCELWLEMFKSVKMHEKCSYETAYILTKIENDRSKKCIKPDKLNGVDIELIYTFLTNALLGHPQPKLNEATKMFLIKEFHKLVALSKTAYADERLDIMLRNMRSPKSLNNFVKKKSRLDPLNLLMGQEIEELLNEFKNNLTRVKREMEHNE